MGFRYRDSPLQVLPIANETAWQIRHLTGERQNYHIFEPEQTRKGIARTSVDSRQLPPVLAFLTTIHLKLNLRCVVGCTASL